MSNLKDETVTVSGFYVQSPGYYGVPIPDMAFLKWYGCREQFHSHSDVTPTPVFFYSHKPGQRERIAAYIARIEQKLGLTIPTMFTPTTNPSITKVEPSPFWPKQSLRYNLLTVFLRACLELTDKHDTDGKVDAVVREYGYYKQTKEAIEYFLNGHTWSLHRTSGWVKTFSKNWVGVDMTPEALATRLRKPRPWEASEAEVVAETGLPVSAPIEPVVHPPAPAITIPSTPVQPQMVGESTGPPPSLLGRETLLDEMQRRMWTRRTPMTEHFPARPITADTIQNPAAGLTLAQQEAVRFFNLDSMPVVPDETLATEIAITPAPGSLQDQQDDATIERVSRRFRTWHS